MAAAQHGRQAIERGGFGFLNDALHKLATRGSASHRPALRLATKVLL